MSNKESILIVDDDAELAKALYTIVTNLGYLAYKATDGETGLKMLGDRQPDILIIDLMMEKMSGIELLNEARKIDDQVIVIIITGYATVATAIEAMKCGALDYLQKPLSKDQIEIVIGKAVEHKRLLRENDNLRSQLDNRFKIDNIVGQSPAMRKIFALIHKVAPTDTNVMISGESGTGKELIARAIHNHSLRKDQSFTAVDCVALPTNLIESELFGYEKGAFTGAAERRKGLLEIAQSGTFFMDEITELDYNLQAKLLRLLQERQFRRVGGRELIDVDIRVISATKRDPLTAVREGRLREDLFYRLNVVPIYLPPLRERVEDIPLLVNHFLESYRAGIRSPLKGASIVMDILQNYSWPGNVRELRNVIERMAIMTQGDQIDVGDVPTTIIDGVGLNFDAVDSAPLSFKDAKRNYLRQFEQKYIRQILKVYNGNISKSASASGVNRKTFYRLMRKYDIQRSSAK